MNRILLFITILLAPFIANAQYTAQGVIEYERKINVHRQFEDEENNEWLQRIKSQVPKFALSYFNLYFNRMQSKYAPGRETENPMKMFGGSPASENQVYTNFTHQKVTAQKSIYEKTFLVEDSMRVLQWKITDEIRTIANYKCRKAVSKICDSVYVVAFYTEDIMVSGGPEMFGGLPGMILELAVPRLYTTWVATKVDLAIPTAKDLAPPVKGKKVNQKELYENMKTGLSDWGKYAAKNIWWSTL